MGVLDYFCSGIILGTVSDTASIITAVATGVLVVVTGYYVVLTHKMLQAMKAAKEPVVQIDFELSGSILLLCVTNAGGSPALSIQFGVIKEGCEFREIENGCITKETFGLDNIDVIKYGISYLATGRTLKYWIGLPQYSEQQNSSPFLLRLTWRSIGGKNFSQDCSFDLNQYKKVSSLCFQDSGHSVSRAIAGAARLISSNLKLEDCDGFQRSSHCPFCLRPINPKAKKCPHCHEWIPKNKTRDSQGETKMNDDNSDNQGTHI